MGKFVGVLLFAGMDNNGNGRYIRLILNDKGNHVDAFTDRTECSLNRSCDKLYDISFPTQLNVSIAEYKRWETVADARDTEMSKRAKRGETLTPEQYHELYRTKW